MVPRFGTAELRVGAGESLDDAARETAAEDSGRRAQGNLISAPGFNAEHDGPSFLDAQPYVLAADAPDAVAMPVRSTSKRLMIDYLGTVADPQPGLSEPYTLRATTPIRLDDDGWPTGAVVHTMAGTMTNVQVIFCRGEQVDDRGRRRPLRPQVWRHVNPDGRNEWAPGVPLTLTGRPDEPLSLTPPFRTWSRVEDQRDWKRNEGLLGRRLDESTTPLATPARRFDESMIVRQLELLSFFDAVPMADLKNDPDARVLQNARLLRRTLGSRLDMTPLLRGRRLIILGHLKDSPLPIPLSVDGQTPPSQGWTFVRWIYDF